MRFKRNEKASQVFVEYRDDVGPLEPLEDRTYTLTHSDETGDLYVTIGLTYATDKLNDFQDQVYLRWVPIEDKLFLYGEVLIDGEGVTGNPGVRHEIFRRELPLALYAIYVGDGPLFEAYPELNNTPVLINFQSSDPQYDKLYNYDTIGSYSSYRKIR